MTTSPLPSAVYGLGIIGSRVATRLADHGIPTITWNRTPRPGIHGIVATPADAAQRARVHHIFVRDEAAVDMVLAGILPALGAGHIVLVHATVPQAAVQRWSAAVGATGAGFLDAPFTGSRGAAEAGNLVYYIGGDEAVLEQVRPNLLPSSKAILHLGPVGHAAVVKIATNMVTTAIVQALAEAMAVTKSAGVDPALLLPAIANNGCRSGTSDLKLPAMLAGDFQPHFSLRNMLKDARFAAAIATVAGITLPAHAATTARMEAMAAIGGTIADSDFSILARQWDASPGN